MATTMCEIDGRRPAVATVRIRQNGEERTIAVCEEHLRELQGQSRGAGRSPFGGGAASSTSSSPTSSATAASAAARPAPPVARPRRARAARPSRSTSRSTSATPPASCSSVPRRRRWSGAAWTSTRHTCSGPRRRTRSSGTCCSRSAPTPPRSRRRSRRRPTSRSARTSRRRCRRTRRPRCLAAYEESRQIGASYVGPEHVLLALAQDTETEAGELLERFGDHAHEAARRGHPRRRERRGGRPPGEHDEDARRVRPRPHGGGPPGQARPGDRPRRPDRADDRDPLAPHEEQPGADRRPRRRQDRDRRGHRPADRQRRGARDAHGQAPGGARPGRAWSPARSTAASSRSA